MSFDLQSKYVPTGDQPSAIEQLHRGVLYGMKNQVLLGVTGSGKTFTMANVIHDLNMPALIISHNKTLAGQLYQEFRDFFPNNAVSYFVSYYDYYQPEAYIPSTDTYIEKEAEINELIDKLRLQSSTNILTRKDVIVVASVSCIYNIGSPAEYGKYMVKLHVGDFVDWKTLSVRLTELLYERSEFDFSRGTFRVRGSHMDIYLPYEDCALRILEENGRIQKIERIDPLTGQQIKSQNKNIDFETVYPAKLYLTDPVIFNKAEAQIRSDLKKEYSALKKMGKKLEAQRLLRKVNYDLEMIKEVGYVNGIENYSRYFDGRKHGDPPYSLLDYFKHAYGKDFLVFIDESHMTVPQIRGMYNGDHSRKQTLIDFGFRLNASLDNRPLKFDEFYKIPSKIIYVSATPNEWEKEQAKEEVTQHTHADTVTQTKNKSAPHNGIVEQLIRPTGIIDPEIEIRPATSEIPDLIKEIEKRAKKETPGGHHHPEIIYTKPVLVRRDGIERWELAALRKEVLMEFVKGLKQSGTTVSIASIKQAPLTDIYFPALSPDFSEQQQNALSLAKKEGYYDFPRKAWLAQLANVSGVSISTFREHLRKAERKLLSTAH